MKRSSVPAAPVLSAVAMNRIVAYLNLLMAVDRNQKSIRKPKAKKAVERGPQHSGPCLSQWPYLSLSSITPWIMKACSADDRHHCAYA